MVPLWRTAGSPINPASSASAGIASPTIAERATSACLAVAPITSERPFISIPSRPSMWERSTRCGGLASRCFITGSRVWPPAMTLASSFFVKRLAACRTVAGRWYLNSYMRYPGQIFSVAVRWCRSGEIGVRHRLGARRDRQNDVLVAGAAAEIAFELFADGVIAEIVSFAVDHIDRGHDHAGGAETALQAVMLSERLLHRMQGGAVGGQALDGPDLVPVSHDRERGAGFDRLAVEMHDAGAALRGVAADMGAGQPQIFTQKLHQQGARVDIVFYGIAVHDQGDFGHQHSLHLRPFTRQRSHF